jgi:hypothetical protein
MSIAKSRVKAGSGMPGLSTELHRRAGHLKRRRFAHDGDAGDHLAGFATSFLLWWSPTSFGSDAEMMLMRSLRDPQVQAAHVLVSERIKALAAGEPDAAGPAQDALNFLNELVQPRPM